MEILDGMVATSLRPRGAVYWIPEYRVSEWDRVSKVVEDASVGRLSAVYLLRNIMDGDACRDVMDSVIAEVKTSVEGIDREIRDGKLGVRGLEHRQTMAQELRQKVSEDEDLLGVEMVRLHELVDQTETAACRAAVFSSAAARTHAQAG